MAISKMHSTSSAWLREFKEKHGRPLRVLHIGNIANNAYLNAKIMRRAGIDADVICPNYYHVMACPEWEDADYKGDFGDPDRPRWDDVNLNGFIRPEWFIQGHRSISYKYVNAYRRNAIHWAYCYKFFIDSSALGFKRAVRNFLSNKNAGSLTARLFVLSIAMITTAFPTAIEKFLPCAQKVVEGFTRAILRAQIKLCEVFRLNWCTHKIMSRTRILWDEHNLDEYYREQHAINAKKFIAIAQHYDFIIGYATEGLYPFLAGLKNFASYEHGTIREIPFEDTEQGKLCALTYQNSPVVFITNTDCVAAADKLGIERARQYWVPHAIDTNKLFSLYEEMRSKVSVAVSPHVFLSPARQHWKVDKSGLGKGNDRVIHAAKILSDEGLDFKIQFVEWGQHVDASKELIAELGIEEKFDWVPIIRKRELRIAYMSASAVIDQFVFPALGGVTFEALALGRPVISYLDTKQVTEFFGEMPPLHNCNTADGIAAAMRSVICDAEKTDALGRAAQDWVRKYHSSERVLDIEITAIRKTLSCHKESSPDGLRVFSLF